MAEPKSANLSWLLNFRIRVFLKSSVIVGNLTVIMQLWLFPAVFTKAVENVT